MFIEFSDESRHYEGVGPHTVCSFYFPVEADCAGVIQMRIGGLTADDQAIAGNFTARFNRVGGIVTVDGFDSIVELAAPVGSSFTIDESGGVIRGRFTGPSGFAGDIAARADAMGGP